MEQPKNPLRQPDHYGKHELNVDEDAIYSFNRKMSEAYRPDYFITLDTFLGDTKATDRAHANLTRKVRLFFRRLSNKTKQHIRYVCWYDQAPTSGKLHIHGSVTFEKFIIPANEVRALWLAMVKNKLPEEVKYLDDKMSVEAWLSAVKETKLKAAKAIDITNDEKRVPALLYRWTAAPA